MLCLLGAFLKLLCQVEHQRRGRHFYKGDIVISSIGLILSYCALILFVSAGDSKTRDFCFCQVMFLTEFLVVNSPQVHNKPFDCVDCVDVELQVTVFTTRDKSCVRHSVLKL